MWWSAANAISMLWAKPRSAIHLANANFGTTITPYVAVAWPDEYEMLWSTALSLPVLDATYVKAHDGASVVSKAIVVATGVTARGDREVLGCAVGDRGRRVLDRLRARGPAMMESRSWRWIAKRQACWRRERTSHQPSPRFIDGASIPPLQGARPTLCNVQ